MSITTMNISNTTSTQELKCSTILAQLGKKFQAVSIDRKDMEHGVLHVTGFVHGEYISFHVHEDRISVLQEDGDAINPHFEDFYSIKEVVEYISTIGTNWWMVKDYDFQVDGSYFGKCFRDLLLDKHVKVENEWLSTMSGEYIPVEPADPEDVAVFVNGQWWAPSHNIYYYKEERETRQANIC